MLWLLYDIIDALLFVGLPIAAIGYIVYLFFKKKTGDGEAEAVVFPKHIVWAILIVILGYNFFAFESVPGIGYGLFNLCLIAAILLCFPKEKRSPLVYVLAITSVAAGLLLAVRANDFTHSINLLTMVSIGSILLVLHAVDHAAWQHGWIFKYLFGYVKSGLRKGVALLRISRDTKSSKHGVLVASFKTVVLTALLLFFFTALLGEADPVFSKIIDQFADEAVSRTIISIVLAALFLWVLVIKVDDRSHENSDKKSFFSFYDAFIPGLVILVLFASFLFIQAKYLFAPEAAFAALDITYSDYVRKGFIELLTAAAFGGLLTYIFYIKQQKLDNRSQAVKLRLVNVLLVLSLGLMLASALMRNTLYIDAFGLSRVRVIGLIFLGWLAGVMVLLFLVNAIKSIRERELFRGIIALSITVVLLLNGINIDQFVAASPPPEGRFKDIYYTTTLSADALQGWREAIYQATQVFDKYRGQSYVRNNEKITNEFVESYLAVRALQTQRENLDKQYAPEMTVVKKYHPDALFKDTKQRVAEIFDWYEYRSIRTWKAYNWSKSQAFETINDESDVFIDTVDCLVDEYANYFFTHRYNFDSEISRRMSDYSSQFVGFYHYVSPPSLDRYDAAGNKIPVLPAHAPQSCSSLANTENY